MRPIALALALTLGLVGAASAEESDPAGIVTAYLSALSGDDPDKAFTELMEHSPVDEAKPLEIQAIRGQIAQVLTLYGKPLDYEQVFLQPFGSSVVRYVYITRHRALPLVWEFWLYKSDGAWQVLNFHVNDRLQGLR